MKERGKKKRIKKRTTSETSGTMLNAPTFESQESQKKKTKRKAMRKYLRRLIVENFPKMGKEVAIQVQETQTVPKMITPR